MDWTGLMRLGLRGLGLRPAEFWALTPRELALMAGREAGAAPMTRQSLRALAAAYPDDRGGPQDGR